MKIGINFNSSDIQKLELALKKKSLVNFMAVGKKSLTQLLNRARKGGTPEDTRELVKSSGSNDKAMGYTKEYAPHVEYGHRTLTGGFVRGQHYLKSNVEIQSKIYEQDLREVLKK